MSGFYLKTLDADGTVRLWNLGQASQVTYSPGGAPDAGAATPRLEVVFAAGPVVLEGELAEQAAAALGLTGLGTGPGAVVGVSSTAAQIALGLSDDHARRA